MEVAVDAGAGRDARRRIPRTDAVLADPRLAAAADRLGRDVVKAAVMTAQGTAQRLAEADGNRTRLTEMLGHNGFEDRAHHQTRYASVVSLDGRSSPANRGKSAQPAAGDQADFPQSRAGTAKDMSRRD